MEILFLVYLIGAAVTASVTTVNTLKSKNVFFVLLMSLSIIALWPLFFSILLLFGKRDQ